MGFIFPMLRECSFLLHCLSGLMETQSLHFAKIIFLFLLFSFSTLAWKHWRPPAESVHAWEAEVSAVYPVQWIPTPVGTTQYPVSVYPVGRTNPETSPGRAVLVAPPTPHSTLSHMKVFQKFLPAFPRSCTLLSCKSAEECGDRTIKQGSLPQAFLSRPWRAILLSKPLRAMVHKMNISLAIASDRGENITMSHCCVYSLKIFQYYTQYQEKIMNDCSIALTRPWQMQTKWVQNGTKWVHAGTGLSSSRAVVLQMVAVNWSRLDWKNIVAGLLMVKWEKVR